MASNDKRVFISHSSKDRDLASKLVEFLEAGLILKPEEILCTSVAKHMLPIGSQTSETLRKEINSAELIIGIITPDSVQSKYVLFELGASWGLSRRTLPLLAKGGKTDILPGPLKELHASDLSDLKQIYQILDDITKETQVKGQTGGAAAIITSKAKALRMAASPSLEISLVNADESRFAIGEPATWGRDGPPCCNFHLSVRNPGAEKASNLLVKLVAIRKPPVPTAPNLLHHPAPLEKAFNPSDQTPVLIGPGDSKLWNLGFLLSHEQRFMLAAVDSGSDFQGNVKQNEGLLAEVQVSAAKKNPKKIQVKIIWDNTPFGKYDNAFKVKQYFHLQEL